MVIAVVGAFLFFGWKQLPDMARSVGRSLRVFKTEIKGMSEDDKAREAAKASRRTGGARRGQAAREPAQGRAPPAAAPVSAQPVRTTATDGAAASPRAPPAAHAEPERPRRRPMTRAPGDSTAPR